MTLFYQINIYLSIYLSIYLFYQNLIFYISNIIFGVGKTFEIIPKMIINDHAFDTTKMHSAWRHIKRLHDNYTFGKAPFEQRGSNEFKMKVED